MFTLEAFGKKIKALRRDRGLSQQQLADNLFVSRKTVGNWETGNRFPDITMISKLADELRVETYELLDEMNGAYKPTNVIVVDDEPIILKGFVHVLTDTLPDMQIAGFQTAADAIAYAHTTRVEIAFLDIELGGESGISLAETLQKLNPSTNIIFLTGHPEYAYQALNLHCSGYVLKPLTPEKIKKELAHLRFPLRGIRETAGAENGSTDKNEAPEQE